MALFFYERYIIFSSFFVVAGFIGPHIGQDHKITKKLMIRDCKEWWCIGYILFMLETYCAMHTILEQKQNKNPSKMFIDNEA